jgi:hypothetical protein
MGSYGEYKHTLVSGGSGPHSAAFANGDPGFKAMRTANGRTYVEHETGERELYDLRTDPRQVRSLHDEPERMVEVSALSARLETLEYCPGILQRAFRSSLPQALWRAVCPPVSCTPVPLRERSQA